MPQSLRFPPWGSLARRSLGHLSIGVKPATASTASAMASPAAIVRRCTESIAISGRSNTDMSSDAPAGATHVRPKRPRPALWWSATTTVPEASPSLAASRRYRLVESTSGRRIIGPRRDSPGKGFSFSGGGVAEGWFTPRRIRRPKTNFPGETQKC